MTRPQHRALTQRLHGPQKGSSEVNPKLFRFNGGAEGDRTPDLVTASHALSQLSYGPTESL